MFGSHHQPSAKGNSWGENSTTFYKKSIGQELDTYVYSNNNISISIYLYEQDGHIKSECRCRIYPYIHILTLPCFGVQNSTISSLYEASRLGNAMLSWLPYLTDSYFHDILFVFVILCFITNIKAANMKNTAGKSANINHHYCEDQLVLRSCTTCQVEKN